MRFVVYGAGAIGGVLGARLFQNGHDVALIARGAHFEAIRDHGLRIESPHDEALLAIPVVDHPAQLTLTGDDVVVLAMKSQDTIAACEALDACAPPGIAVACFQNGVENERVVLRHFAATYAVCVMSPTAHTEPGVVVAQSAPVSGLLDIGCYPGGLDDRAHAIADALNASTFHSIPRMDVMRWKYTKLLMNLGNSVDAAIAADPRTSELTKRLRTEGEACLRAAGIDFASRDEDKERRGDRMSVQPVNGEFRGGGSSWQSLARGTGTIETDYLNGEIVMLGRMHGVPTPANELMQRVANEAARTGAPPKSVPIDSIFAQLDQPLD
jgi:2-dehydropantoate 2-reductase